MSVSVEKTSNLGRRLTIEVPAASVQKEEQNRLKDLAKNMRLDGFRPGTKATEVAVKNKYGAQIRQDAVSKIIQESLGSALKEQNMRPASRPSVEELNDAKDQNLKYTVVFDVYPEVILGDFSN